MWGRIKDFQRVINEWHGKNPLNFSKIPIPLLTLANLSLRCSLKLSFLSSLSPKCFWVCTFSTTNLLKQRFGWKDSRGFFWKKNFLSLFCWVWIKSHFPLFSPSSNFIKVFIQYICCFKLIRNYWKQGSIIGKQLDIRF